MTLQQLNYVITISEVGSLNKAAEVLYVSQPSLSEAVRDLERSLGITIFHRSGRGVTLTNDGAEFIAYAKQIYNLYESLMDKYGQAGTLKKKFSVSTQHYSFAVKAFAETVKQFNTAEYDFAIRETKTAEVIEDVSSLRSEIGILYLSSFNQKAIMKLLKSNGLVFNRLIDCGVYVYLWKGHPLAKCKSIRFEQLGGYPCLSFDRGTNSPFYFAEEILSTNDYPRIIRVNDRAAMLNLLVELSGYTLCPGIVCGEPNGTDFAAVPFETEDNSEDMRIEIGYITKKNHILSKMGSLYVEEIEKYLHCHVK